MHIDPIRFLILISFSSFLSSTGLSKVLTAEVVVEETITVCLAANNGAGPMWCFGSPLIVRQGDEVFASIMETGEGIPPLSNTRWRLFRRDRAGWNLMQAAPEHRLREPSPLVGFRDGTMFLSTTPSVEAVGNHYGRVATHLLRFDSATPTAAPIAEEPDWGGERAFTDHSYRGVASDGENREVLWLNIDSKSSVQHASHRDADGVWSYRGGIEFPVRSAYPQVALSNGAAHVLAIGDIVEPIEEWRTFKFEQSGQKWDYVFRRLYHVWTPNLSETPFSEPLEIDTVESTAGHITNLDLWIGPEGEAHVLYLKSTVQSAAMRDRFFPGLPILKTLEYTVLREGAIVKRETLLVGGEGDFPVSPSYGRFHSTPDGRLWAVCAGIKNDDPSRRVLHLMQVHPSIDRENPIEIPLKTPFAIFFTASERGGSAPSRTLDLFGQTGDILHYAQVELRSDGN